MTDQNLPDDPDQTEGNDAGTSNATPSETPAQNTNESGETGDGGQK